MLAQHLATVAHSMSYASAERLSRQYLEVLAEFGVALRDLVPDPEARHRLAQEIQIAILRHERRLREALAPAIQK